MSDQSPSSTQIKPPEQRPEHPDFWSKRFAEGVTPWDAGKVPAAFAAFIAAQPAPLNTLIPGCGSAWEARHLAELGWPVTALDFAPAAVATARAVLGGAKVDLVCADFFTFTAASYALIYERAWLAGYFFLCDQPKGPPFGILPEQLDELLAPNFACIEDAAVSDSIPVFAGHERWQVWQRR